MRFSGLPLKPLIYLLRFPGHHNLSRPPELSKRHSQVSLRALSRLHDDQSLHTITEPLTMASSSSLETRTMSLQSVTVDHISCLVSLLGYCSRFLCEGTHDYMTESPTRLRTVPVPQVRPWCNGPWCMTWSGDALLGFTLRNLVAHIHNILDSDPYHETLI